VWWSCRVVDDGGGGGGDGSGKGNGKGEGSGVDKSQQAINHELQSGRGQQRLLVGLADAVGGFCGGGGGGLAAVSVSLL
jgi:hypothetical protein